VFGKFDQIAALQEAPKKLSLLIGKRSIPADVTEKLLGGAPGGKKAKAVFDIVPQDIGDL